MTAIQNNGFKCRKCGRLPLWAAGFSAALVLFPALAFSSCMTPAKAERRLLPIKTTSEFRQEDIEKYVVDDPVKAIHYIEMYRRLYGEGSVFPEQGDPSLPARIDSFEERAVETLKIAQIAAIAAGRWEDAASFARSLAVLGISVESTGEEPDLVLKAAKDQLEAGNDLPAFLGAARAHELKPLELEDALLFLDKAVDAGQRRTAAFFLAAAEGRLEGREGEVSIPQQYRSFVAGRDSAADMIKGVATVLVDRGYRVERGVGMPDRILGSAFFVDSSGLLITNYHVIASEVDPGYEGYSRMYIRMGDSASARIPAKVVGWDKAMDLALIKAEFKPEYVFSVADRVIPGVGGTVYAIGSPGGLEKTVTRGIVSALGRRFLQIGDVLQIDAMVNHGNSGGPVVDEEGRLVGIVFAGVAQYPGLNFAVPAERLAAALPAMIRGGRAERPWLGLTIAETARGAEIIYVAPFTPAAEQRIPEGSLIARFNGMELSAPQGALIPAYQEILFANKPGELVSLETGGGEKYTLMTTARPDIPLANAARVDTKERLAAPLFGLILSPAIMEGFFSSAYQVKRVVRGSVADEAGLSEQDPVSIRGFRIVEKEGYALLDINVKKRRMGYLETSMRLPAALDSPDTL
ncbi:MAG: S1C family serine protease [Treponema sp.]|jgi:S1-C subfamily serine protease|nr:S1C family serine protease [Treponema sp.]